MKKSLTYKQSGVDIDEANKFVGNIKAIAKKSFRPGVMGNVGGFGACFDFSVYNKYRAPVLVSSTDGVGTKLKIAILSGIHSSVGIDLVAMNVNDILAAGAEPLFFLDYISIGKVDCRKLTDIGKGIVKGCEDAGCALIGGETAEMPAIYAPEEYDLAGFCVGVVEKDELISGANIKPGDVLLGLASSGLHSNGYSMVHKVFSKNEIVKNARELLKPTKIYVKSVLALRKKCQIKGIAHITGGAFYEKLGKIFPRNCQARVYKGTWPIPQIFKEIAFRGKVAEKEMFRTFNMGIGMVLALNKSDVDAAIRHFSGAKIKSWVIGEVVKGNSGVEILGGNLK